VNRATLYAPAKLNLRLKVTGQREDGYHLLDMLNVTISLCDAITVRIKHGNCDTTLSLKNDSVYKLSTEENLLLQVCSFFKQEFSLLFGCELELQKNIPVGGGLGGGSSNAATLLNYLAFQMKDEVSIASGFEDKDIKSRIETIALKLGADVPYFLRGGGSAHVLGIGEYVEPLEWDFLQNVPCILLIPHYQTMTKEVYRQFDSMTVGGREKTTAELTRFIDNAKRSKSEKWQAIINSIDNDLEEAFLSLCPQAQIIRECFRGNSSYIAGLSGSGGVWFVLPSKLGISGDELEARVANIISEKEIGKHYSIVRSYTHKN